jgi:hypothetical protein
MYQIRKKKATFGTNLVSNWRKTKKAGGIFPTGQIANYIFLQ